MRSKPGWVEVIQKADSFFDKISKVCFALAAALILAVTLMIFASVINRTFIGGVWLFVEEYATLALIPMSYLVFGYVLRQNRHLNLDLVFNKCSYHVKIGLSIFTGVFTILVCCFMMSQAWSYMQYQLESHVVSSGAMKTPLWPLSLCIFLSILLFVIDLIFYVINRVIQLLYDDQPLKFEGRIYRDGDPRMLEKREIDGVELDIPEEHGPEEEA